MVFFTGDAIVSWAGMRFFGYFGIPLDDFVSEPVPGAFFDFLFQAWYLIAFFPSVLIWLAPESKESYVGSLTGDGESKVVLSVIAHVVWLIFSLALLVGVVIE